MKMFTKSMMGLSALLTLGWSATAQLKECDLSLRIVSPMDYSTVPYGDTVRLVMELKNNGKDPIVESDVIYFGMEGSSMVFHYHDLSLSAGETIEIHSPFQFPNRYENEMEQTICMLILDQKDISEKELAPNGIDSIDVPVPVTYNDRNSDNNFACVTLTMSPKPKTSVANVLEQRNLNVYPNPANDFLNVDMSGLEGADATITVRDLTGRIILEQYYKQLSTPSSTWNIYTRQWSNGLYLVEVSTSKGSAVAKVAIQ